MSLNPSSPAPTPDPGGTPPPQPAPAAPPPPQQQALPLGQQPPQTVAVPMADLQSLLSLAPKLAEYETRWQQLEREKHEAIVAEQVKRGQVEDALKTVREQTAKELEGERAAKLAEQARARGFARKAELGQALAGLPFVSEAAARQFADLIAPQFEAHPEGEGFAVRNATYETPAQVVARLRTDPAYLHFFRPSTGGGVGAPGADRSTPTPPPGAGAENTIEAAAARWMALRQSTLPVPFGLTGRRG